jgi:hypothetical protein
VKAKRVQFLAIGMFIVLAGASCTQTQQPAARFEPTRDSLKQSELREGHAQTPEAAKEELALMYLPGSG